MKLVFLIFFILIFGVLLSKLRIDINNLIYSGEEKNIDINVKLMIFRLVPIKIIKINNDNIKILKSNTRIKKITEKAIAKFDIQKARKSLKIKDLKNLKIKAKKINLYVKYSTNNVLLTTYLTPIIATIISYIYYDLINNYNDKYYRYKLNPMYIKKRYLYIKLESIIEVRMWNIINMILLFRRKMK
ncbi:MAG: hypothetical protein IKF52_02340 [Clostridia bacterium]|nr:hypothetical protein [Clostridia bacterium]